MDIKYGISATFNSAKEIYDAAGKIKEEGYQKIGNATLRFQFMD